MLRPEGDVELNPAPLDCYFNSSRHHIFFPYSIKNYVYRTNEDFPYAVKAEKVSKNVEVFSLKRG